MSKNKRAKLGCELDCGMHKNRKNKIKAGSEQCGKMSITASDIQHKHLPHTNEAVVKAYTRKWPGAKLRFSNLHDITPTPGMWLSRYVDRQQQILMHCLWAAYNTGKNSALFLQCFISFRCIRKQRRWHWWIDLTWAEQYSSLFCLCIPGPYMPKPTCWLGCMCKEVSE